MPAMKPTDAQPRERLRDAWFAHMRQELHAPALLLREASHQLLADTTEVAQPEFRKFVAGIVARSDELVGRVEGLLTAATGGGGTDAERAAFERLLRHDLRSPASYIVSTCQMLQEDAVDLLLEGFLPDLHRIGKAATKLIEMIGNLITFTQTPEQVAPADSDSIQRLLKEVIVGIDTPRQRRPDAEGGRVLVVDDNESNRELVRGMLGKPDHGGHTITTVASGEAALALLARVPGAFDVVLLDVIMRGMNGIEVLKKMRADPRLAGLPVIMVSALGEESGVAACIALGAEDYLTRPLRPALLRARVGACLEKKRLRDREVALLHAIFPPTLVEEYQRTGDVAAARHEDVGVMFMDIVGFTGLSERLPPEKVVYLLNQLVLDGEKVADRHGVLKIKTIGDAFMGTANLLVEVPDPALTLLRCAVDMVAAIGAHRVPTEAGDAPVKVRVGIHVGPVVAGKLGKRQFTFDLWGATVNLAARLESTGWPGRVTLSADAYAAVRGKCECEPRQVELRGIGKVTAWDFVRWLPG